MDKLVKNLKSVSVFCLASVFLVGCGEDKSPTYSSAKNTNGTVSSSIDRAKSGGLYNHVSGSLVTATYVYPDFNGKKFGLGSPATAEQIAVWDIDIRPDGKGLPKGKGTAEIGEAVYLEKCSACHGVFGEGVGKWPVLTGGEGSLKSDHPHKSIGSYWPYTSTLFDYIRRAMPYFAPQSLTNDEVYQIVAYLLNANEIIEADFEVNEKNLASIKLPNENNFYPKEGNYLNDYRKQDIKNTICMKDCVKDVKFKEAMKGVSGEE